MENNNNLKNYTELSKIFEFSNHQTVKIPFKKICKLIYYWNIQ